MVSIAEITDGEKLPAWNLEFLRSMDWKLFEDLCAEVLKASGHQAETTGSGPDRCIDIRMRIPVQCKRQKTPIKVKQVREFLGAVMPQGFKRGVFITSGVFLPQVIDEYGANPDVRLIDGEQFLEGVAELGEPTARLLLDSVVEEYANDWTVPTCPACNIKMIWREPKPGFGVAITLRDKVRKSVGKLTRNISSSRRERVTGNCKACSPVRNFLPAKGAKAREVFLRGSPRLHNGR